ncbi:MAG: biotin transporter BioY [Lachnospiraceae bacterium]|nr:biotin transporter BioY [Lachnospiraceae bacterium]
MVGGNILNNAGSLNKTGNIKTADMVYIAIGAALIAICSWISVPMTVPFTLQTFAVFFVLMTLGGERGTIATVVYVIMGAVGLPVFSGFKGGLGVLLGSTGGYIVGFIVMGLIYIVITKIFTEKIIPSIAALVIGLAACYAFGTAWFMFVYIRNTGPVGVMTVLSWCVFPFIIPDIVKMALAVVISRRVRGILR